MCVCVDGQISDVHPVTVGLTQCVKNCDNNMYADDTALSYTSKLITDLERNINEDLVYLKQYFVINKLSLSIQKCEFLTVGTQQRLTKFKDVNIKINEIDIVKVTVSKYLGFIIDQTLRWGYHIHSMVKK